MELAQLSISLENCGKLYLFDSIGSANIHKTVHCSLYSSKDKSLHLQFSGCIFTDSMVANWESTEDCSSLHSSSYSSEDGEQFLNEEDFASAVAKAAVMSGLTVVGTTVSDPSPKPGKFTK